MVEKIQGRKFTLSKGPKTLLFDIESTGLNATFGTVLTIGYKWLDKKTIHTPTILDYSKKGMLDDKGLVADFAKVYETADITVGHYSSRFDVPMLQSKLLKNGLPPLAPVKHIDTWDVARKNFKLHNNRLNSLAGFLGTNHQKTAIDFESWLQAAHGSKKHLKEVVDHCRYDVLVLEEVFNKIKPWIRQMPARQLFVGGDPMSCPSCGSTHLHSRGYHVSRTRKYRRFQCQDCGKWSRTRISEKEVPSDLVGGY